MKIWKPHNYQMTAMSFLLSNPRSGLFLDPGLGKTSISLCSIKMLKNSGQMKGVLIVAPLRVCYLVWPKEINKWVNFNNLSCTILHGENKDSLWGEHKDVYLINPEGLEWLHNELLSGLKAGKKCPFDTLWIDESTKFKSYKSSRFELLCDMLPLFKRVHIMTGTPAPKGLLDLWSQMYLLDRGESLGGGYYLYRNKYFQADDYNKHKWDLKDFCEKEIHKKIAPLVLEMSAEDHLDMPDLLYNNIDVILSDKTMKLYKRMERDFFAEIDGEEVTALASAQAGMKCHQIANGKIYEDIPEDLTKEEEREFRKSRKVLHSHTSKIESLKNLIEELNGKPLLIAYYYRHDLSSIKDMLKSIGIDAPYIGSGVSQEDGEIIADKWNRGEIPILLGHPSSMGHGLNLQEGGNDICWFSLTWNLEEYDQFNRRIYRQGIKGSVRVHHLVANRTIDEAMLLRLGERANQQKDLRTALKEYRSNL